jgi:ERCC4-type nuclease
MKQVLNLVHTYQNSGLRWEQLTSRNHAFIRINQLYAYYQDPEHTANLVRRSSAGDKRISMLMGIPGVSKELAKRLIERFGDLTAIANANTDLLKTSYNIGDTRARTIWNYFHSKEALH